MCTSSESAGIKNRPHMYGEDLRACAIDRQIRDSKLISLSNLTVQQAHVLDADIASSNFGYFS